MSLRENCLFSVRNIISYMPLTDFIILQLSVSYTIANLLDVTAEIRTPWFYIQLTQSIVTSGIETISITELSTSENQVIYIEPANSHNVNFVVTGSQNPWRQRWHPDNSQSSGYKTVSRHVGRRNILFPTAYNRHSVYILQTAEKGIILVRTHYHDYSSVLCQTADKGYT